jgi:poly-gamma-glutamate synthesis protein (capsule biosynthesis protein)
VNLIADLSNRTAEWVARDLCQSKQPGDVTIASVHWGGNWGYEIPPEQTDFAHRRIECGVDVVHGHSSHHAKAIEVYRDRLILYGCGDFISDYEGIPGYEEYQGELRLMYLAQLDRTDGRLVQAQVIPLRSRRLRLERAAEKEAAWMCDLLNREGAAFGTSLGPHGDTGMSLSWQ